MCPPSPPSHSSRFSMTASVSSMSPIVGRCNEDREVRLDRFTRDLLGGGTVAESSSEAELQHIKSQSACLAPAKRPLLDLNFPPTSFWADDSLAPRLLPVLQPAAATSSAVCTLEMVKLALEREMRSKHQGSTSLSCSTTSSSYKRRTIIEDGPESSSTAAGEEMMLASCPQCFLYVLIAKGEPRCPRCNSHVRVPALGKKPRIQR